MAAKFCPKPPRSVFVSAVGRDAVLWRARVDEGCAGAAWVVTRWKAIPASKGVASVREQRNYEPPPWPPLAWNEPPKPPREVPVVVE